VFHQLHVYLVRSLSIVADLVGQKLSAIPRATVVRYWHQVVLHLFGFLTYERV